MSRAQQVAGRVLGFVEAMEMDKQEKRYESLDWALNNLRVYLERVIRCEIAAREAIK